MTKRVGSKAANQKTLLFFIFTKNVETFKEELYKVSISAGSSAITCNKCNAWFTVCFCRGREGNL